MSRREQQTSGGEDGGGSRADMTHNMTEFPTTQADNRGQEACLEGHQTKVQVVDEKPVWCRSCDVKRDMAWLEGWTRK